MNFIAKNGRMKKLSFVFVFMAVCVGLYGQDVDLSGSWKGELELMGQKLPLVFNFEKTGEGWAGTADSPTQGAKGMKLKKVLFNGLLLSVEFEQLPAVYEGVFVADTIKGNFTQSGATFPLDLVRLSASDNLGMERPQEPQPPFAYEELLTTFSHPEDVGIRLAGTITKPKGAGPFPAIVLISGSGPQNRDGEIFGHKPFWVIADYMTKKGIAVLRYDERGVGESTGDFNLATSEDLKNDASLAISHLKKFPFVNQLKVGAMGHSEGGMIGWMLGADGSNLNFLVTLAAPVVPIDELMTQQTEDVMRSAGAAEEEIEKQLTINNKVYATVKETEEYQDLEESLTKMIEGHLAGMGINEPDLEEQVSAVMKAYSPSLSPWFFWFLKFSPGPYIERIKIPVFAAYAEKDIQVNAKINGEALQQLMSGNENGSKITLYPGLNHLFQQAETGSLNEYALIEETFNQQVLQDVVDWINGL